VLYPPAPHQEQLLSVTVQPGASRGQVVLEVVGEVDAFTAPLLEACLHSQSGRRGPAELVVDLGGVTFLGAAGIAALAQAHRRCRARAARLVLRCGQQGLRPLQRTGLGELVAAEQRPSTRSPRAATRPRRRPRRTPTRRPQRVCRGAGAPR
jgi:anti-sigma B factor antagonist